MTPKSVEKLFTIKELAVEHLKAGRYRQASIYFKDLLQKFQTALPDISTEQQMEKFIREIKFSAHKNLSLCYLKTEQYKLCVGQCETILEVEPNNVKILYRIGMAYIKLGQLAFAEEYLKRGFMIDPQEKEIMKALEMIEGQNASKKMKKIQKKGVFHQALALILSILLWLPLFLFKKGKQLAGRGGAENEKKCQ